jgi:Ala-tRNA(Pro) deacylase
MRGDILLYEILQNLNILFEYYEHPPAYTVEEALKNWKYIDSTHCKNIFLRNHKGDRHYLVIMEYSQPLAIHELEQRYLGVTPGAVSIFGLIHDKNHHVHVFLDENLKQTKKISFHPNDNTASIVISYEDFVSFVAWSGNTFEFIRLA